MITFRIILLIFLFSNPLAGQEKSDFHILADKSIRKLYQNPEDCLTAAQSIVLNDKNPIEKMIIQNIISQAYAMKGDYVQSVKSALDETTSILPQNNSAFLYIFLDYALAEQYQNLGLYHQSEKIIRNILSGKALRQLQMPEQNITIAKIYQLQALNSAVLQNRTSVKKNLDTSNRFLHNRSNEEFIIRSENNLIAALLLLAEKNPEKAKIQIEKTLSEVTGKQYYFLEALALEYLSRIYFYQENYPQAAKTLKAALAKIEAADYLPLKAKIYESLSKNYAALNDTQQYKSWNKLFLSAKTTLDENKKEGIRHLTKLVETRSATQLENFKKNEQDRLYLILGGLLVPVLLLALYYIGERKRNGELKTQLSFFGAQKEASEKKTAQTLTAASAETADRDPQKQPLISREKEQEILLKLDEMEKTKRFLNKNMSLANLAAQLDTNTKYLSEIINKYKGKNFNMYINELRVNHIAYLLKEDPVYLNYKVSYLAEVSGFSSHSSFTTVFKSITGMSPNAYIQQINQQKR